MQYGENLLKKKKYFRGKVMDYGKKIISQELG
jgi:hypothetical protein